MSLTFTYPQFDPSAAKHNRCSAGFSGNSHIEISCLLCISLSNNLQELKIDMWIKSAMQNSTMCMKQKCNKNAT